MKFKVIFLTARCLTIELEDEGIVKTQAYSIYVNGVKARVSDRTVESLYDLLPDTEYSLAVGRGANAPEPVIIRTPKEFVTLNVRDFGAAGDGIREDTAAIQAAILCCPKEGRVLIPAGVYRIGALFLKSDLRLELAAGAVLSAYTDRDKFPILPGLITAWDEEQEYNLASWEGNPLDSFASIITGIGVKNVVIYGQGTI
ncbi:MAG: glycoside hydrolase family 28 protein, partial [Lachnospiraceae bacterium]|nr:glycoside hydrolase family 28 protein [Lachnospiraceae bacterium]